MGEDTKTLARAGKGLPDIAKSAKDDGWRKLLIDMAADFEEEADRIDQAAAGGKPD